VRGELLGSAAVHLVLLVVLLVLRPHAAPVIAGADVIQVSLADPSATAAITPPPTPAPRVEPKPEPEIPPEQAEGVKLQPKKRPPPKKPEPREETPPPVAARPALPVARVGNAGLSGEIAIDQGDFAFTYYLLLVRNKVAQGWAPPAGLTSGGRVKCVVHFRIQRGGDVTAVLLEQGSGVELFDRSAVRAVTLADPLPPLPIGYNGSDLGVHFGFEYTQP
jgi:periplasmic protein TonB